MRYPSPEHLPWLLGVLLPRSDWNCACAQCGEDIIAPEWSEHLLEHCVRQVWSCEACGYRFEETVYLSARSAHKIDHSNLDQVPRRLPRDQTRCGPGLHRKPELLDRDESQATSAERLITGPDQSALI